MNLVIVSNILDSQEICLRNQFVEKRRCNIVSLVRKTSMELFYLVLKIVYVPILLSFICYKFQLSEIQ